MNLDILGIDVSEHNGKLDWQEIKDWGISFAIIRLGYGKGHLDSRFYENINGALDVGLQTGVYYYSYALSEREARKEAWFSSYVLRDAGLAVRHLPMGVWYDMEDGDDWKKNHGMPSQAVLTAMCQSYVLDMMMQGYEAGIYASYDWLMHRIQTEQLDENIPYWCAQWGPHCDFLKARIWQYTDQLEVGNRGFDGNVLVGSD